MEKAATDIYTFGNLRKGSYSYVDKTAILKKLADDSRGRQFFIARPRRFGKSLAVSTLKCLFEGKRDLFEGLAIEPVWDWSRKWPVLHIDMGSAQSATVSELKVIWRDILSNECARNGIPFRDSEVPSIALSNTINDLAAESDDGQVVVLVDEYDKPLLGHLMTPQVTEFKEALKAFYSVLKTLEGKQRFLFITGVSKFSKVSIFSDLNNLDDITLDASVATLFGYTHEEVRKNFPECLAALGEKLGKDAEGAFAEIVKWYDGYKFEENAKPVINPVSLGLCFDNGKFSDYWSATAMPTFLIDILKEHPLDFSTVNVSETALNAYEPDKPRIVTLLFQTGYLTIKDFCQIGTSRRYGLRFPNLEIENSFLDNVVGAYVGQDPEISSGFAFDAAKALYSHDVPKFIKALKSLFRDIPYDMTDRQNEQMWQTICYVVLRSIGVNVNGEVKTNDGRIDMVVDLPDDIYIVEFKLDRPAAEAMEQIKGKDYAGKYALSKKRVTLVGISFSAAKRTIVEELVEELPHD